MCDLMHIDLLSRMLCRKFLVSYLPRFSIVKSQSLEGGRKLNCEAYSRKEHCKITIAITLEILILPIFIILCHNYMKT